MLERKREREREREREMCLISEGLMKTFEVVQGESKWE
jgi:hypothetical protein